MEGRKVKQTLALRIPQDLFEQAESYCETIHVSFSGWCKQILTDYLQERRVLDRYGRLNAKWSLPPDNLPKRLNTRWGDTEKIRTAVAIQHDSPIYIGLTNFAMTQPDEGKNRGEILVSLIKSKLHLEGVTTSKGAYTADFRKRLETVAA